ncbi:MAG: 2,3-bisphosphoglycerate-independent phosphoglycerate mutase [Alphaproteobacteria bacterium]|nr:2,3-bisphosphoglycerate-independent phosphoglycerate mutase [Alphaproteobacteria bacterium]
MNVALPHSVPSAPARPVVLCILDGFGWRPETEANAVALANAPHWKRLFAQGPRTFLKTSGPAVGLPEGQMGNSEVGHMNIGSGRVLVQDLDRISNAASDGSLRANEGLKDLIGKVKAAGGDLHLLGLLSPGGVHSHQDHMIALALIAADAGLKVHVHAFTDGRDVPPKSALEYLGAFEAAIAQSPRIATATIGGRFYGMDRDKRWDRLKLAYDAITLAKAPRFANPREAIEAAYASDTTDEFVLPAVLGGYDGMHDGDGVLMANFRADRARQIMGAIIDPGFDGFARERVVRFSAAAGLSEYSAHLAALMPSLFPPQDVPKALGEVLSAHGLRQLRLAETEKYAHVTFFFNGGRETVFEGEDRIMVPSPKVRTYDLKPEMSAPEVTQALIDAIAGGRYDVIVVNYANADQVGHSGVLEAAVKAIEAVDECLGRVMEAVERAGGVMLVTADHGNAEMMVDPITGEPHTAHTTLDVPLLLVNAKALGLPVSLRSGRLADLAPTILAILGIEKPAEMTGTSLIDGQRSIPDAAAIHGRA